MPQRVEAVLDEAIGTCDSLLQDLDAAEAKCRALHALTTAQEIEWNHLFRVLPAACLLTDASGTVVTANERAAQLLNISTRHLTDRVLTYFMEDRDAFLTFLGKLSGEAGELRLTACVRPRERAPVQLDLLVIPQRPGDTSLWLWFLIAADAEQPSTGKKKLSASSHAAASY